MNLNISLDMPLFEKAGEMGLLPFPESRKDSLQGNDLG